MEVNMAFEIIEISYDGSSVPADITGLWHECFGDTKEYISSFCKGMPVKSFVCGYADGTLASLTVLIRPSKEYSGYYGYAVCTSKNHRGKGYAGQLHKYIESKCNDIGFDYFLHPATRELEGFYRRLGMKTVSSFFEIVTASYPVARVRSIRAAEYLHIRDTYFGGFLYCPWSVASLDFMQKDGVRFLGATVDGVECAAAVSEDTVLELCAPEYLQGKAAAAFLSDSATVGSVRFVCEPNHVDRAAIMSLSGKWMYFNLFLD